jgi:hypothetical protein
MGYLLALIALRRWEDVKGVSQKVSQNGQLLSRRGRSLPASASGLDSHRASITRRFDCSGGQAGSARVSQLASAYSLHCNARVSRRGLPASTRAAAHASALTMMLP